MDPPTAYTTSSDTGIVLEELIASQAADRMELDHEIVVPRVDRFDSDFRAFVDAVDHQTSYHVWLVPLLEQIAGADAARASTAWAVVSCWVGTSLRGRTAPPASPDS